MPQGKAVYTHIQSKMKRRTLSKHKGQQLHIGEGSYSEVICRISKLPRKHLHRLGVAFIFCKGEQRN